jgi:hypothetical protein
MAPKWVDSLSTAEASTIPTEGHAIASDPHTISTEGHAMASDPHTKSPQRCKFFPNSLSAGQAKVTGY